ncbi:MAG: adenosylcobinamide-GDP ribazoletransferase [Chloroflexi bacterium]|nr:adenosylcobinamide-GDP ribazoletransferase [Chloroflexota bacterium]
MVSLRTAFAFLTILPGLPANPSARQLSASRAYYPVVGLALGLLLVALEAASSSIFPVFLTSALIVVSLVIATRGLHLDGLMDVCDGLFGGYTRERRLEIMRDSNVGAFAVSGALSVLLLKWAAILSLLSLREGEIIWVLILFPVISRWGIVLLMGAFPYARTQGMGSDFHREPAMVATVTAGMIALAASLLLGGLGGMAALGLVTALVWLLGKGMAAYLGGLTGDCYGAANEVGEVVALGILVALVPHDLVTPMHQLLGL